MRDLLLAAGVSDEALEVNAYGKTQSIAETAMAMRWSAGCVSRCKMERRRRGGPGRQKERSAD